MWRTCHDEGMVIMWVANGRLNTNAAADPRVVIGDDAFAVLRSQGRRRRGRVRRFDGWLIERERTLYDELLPQLDSLPTEDEIEPWPPEPLIGEVSSIEDIQEAFERIPLVWKLDALMALEDAS